MNPEEHSHSGQGAVLLDIGGDVGALVVHMPARHAGREVQIRRAGDTAPVAADAHVSVILRRAGSATDHTAVFPSLREGEYELSLRPAGPARVWALVTGGAVAEAFWPTEEH
jgi:hypothetical protein